MAAKKKETETQNLQVPQSNAPQVLMVDAKKLSQGLKTTFEGVAMVFDSIGVEADLGQEMPTEQKVVAPVQNAESDAVPAKVAKKEKAEVKTEAAVTTPAETTEDAKEEKEQDQTPVESNASASSASSITIDDITKIIVQKIKQNRGNNEKIGAILKTYGVSKVGELPDTKYEAFLTDLSAI